MFERVLALRVIPMQRIARVVTGGPTDQTQRAALEALGIAVDVA
jgi:hypothetical protein